MPVLFDFNDDDEEKSGYTIDGAEIEAVKVKGASDAVAREANANIRIIADRLQRGEIDAAEFYSSMQREVKFLHMAQASLARGGIDAMRPEDWKYVENIVAEQFGGVEGKFPGLRAFAKDITRGRYGNAGEISAGFLDRAGMYGDAGRGTYENQRLRARMELYPLEAKRVRGALDGCRDCVAWTSLGWIDADLMQREYPICASVCGARCHCVIVTRRATVDAKNAVGWRALQPALQNAAKVAGGGAAVVGVLALIRFAGNNPRVVSFALGLLMRVLGTQKI